VNSAVAAGGGGDAGNAATNTNEYGVCVVCCGGGWLVVVAAAIKLAQSVGIAAVGHLILLREIEEEKGGKVTCLTGVCVCSHYLTTEVTLFVEELLAKGS